ncbi:hypothetical protein BFW87_13025 [Pseudomonas fluorescens]|uniref:Uncharacterized protein n=1 Tax=Pseudomonas fluorescens TaxID=294 RepID=A0A1T2YS28_PSEFL|nr:hypothetical protein BFW87_13025 [Pseudomonas fluorescens]
MKVTPSKRRPTDCTVAPIPKIEVINKGALWEVHWDYQEGPASMILCNRADYLRGYYRWCAGDPRD